MEPFVTSHRSFQDSKSGKILYPRAMVRISATDRSHNRNGLANRTGRGIFQWQRLLASAFRDNASICFKGFPANPFSHRGILALGPKRKAQRKKKHQKLTNKQTSLFPHYKPSSPQNHSTRKHQFKDLLCYPDSQFLRRRDYNLLMRNGKGICTPWGLKDLIFLFGWFFGDFTSLFFFLFGS